MELNFIEKKEFDRILESPGNGFEKMGVFADMCRYNTFVSVKKAGSGHLGSSFSAMDIIVYLYLKEINILKEGLTSFNRDIYFSSKGHDVPGLYSLFYALGIVSENELLSLRRLGGLDGHPDVGTKGIEANTGSLGMGISKGKGMAWAKHYLNLRGKVFVLTGDGEFQEGQIYESLQSTAHQKINDLTVIIDRNKFQTDMLVDDVNNIEILENKVASFGWFVTSCSGHDFSELDKTFNKLKSVKDKPKFVIADTIKGKGISFLEESAVFSGKRLYKWHSGAPDDESFEKGINELYEKIFYLSLKFGIEPVKYKFIESFSKIKSLPNKVFITDAYGDALCELAEKRKDIIVLDGDLAADCKLRKFEHRYPEQFIENGIAEQDMVSMAGGLARMGLLPIVNSFASFLSSRANEQIYNNACEHSKIIYTFHFSGLIPAGPGKSHQSVRDISLMGAIPNITILQPCNPAETKMVVNYCAFEAKENCVIRLVIGPSPGNIELPENYCLTYGKGVTVLDGNDAVLFTYGPIMLYEALSAAEILVMEGFSLKIINMPWLNRIDGEWLKNELTTMKTVYILEDHSITGGLGDKLIYTALSNGINENVNYIKLGLDDYPACGTPQEVLGFHKLDGISLAERILGKVLKFKENSEKNVYNVDAPQ